jgi:hypothetical protein
MTRKKNSETFAPGEMFFSLPDTSCSLDEFIDESSLLRGDKNRALFLI